LCEGTEGWALALTISEGNADLNHVGAALLHLFSGKRKMNFVSQRGWIDASVRRGFSLPRVLSAGGQAGLLDVWYVSL
jgi:hypothetical protein